MSIAAIAASTGAVSAVSGNVVAGVIPSQTDDATHVSTNPDEGRLLMQIPNGAQYTNQPSITCVVYTATASTSVTLIKEPA